MEVRPIYRSGCELGEGPLWHEERKSLLWVDIERMYLYEGQGEEGDFHAWHLPRRVSLIRPWKNQLVLLSIQGGLAGFDLDNSSFTWLKDMERDLPSNRSNDGICDERGRLWLGTMHLQFREGEGSLYVVGHDFRIEKKLEGLTISNGMAWSADYTKLYHIDSPTGNINCYDVDMEQAEIRLDRTVISIPPSMGIPDGMTIDQDGYLWVAHYGGYGVCQWDPRTGKNTRKIEVPAPHVTSCCFGGPEYDQLLITTARQELSNEQLEKYPLSGSVFVCQPGAKGLAALPFKG